MHKGINSTLDEGQTPIVIGGVFDDAPQPIAFHPTQDPISSTEQTHSLSCGSKSGVASVAIAFEPRYFTRDNKTGGAPAQTPALTAIAWKAGDASPHVAYSVPDIAATLGGGSGQRGWSNDLDRSGAFIPVLAPTLTAANDPSRSPQLSEITQQVHAVHQAAAVVRRLTPVECCRLQGFPDDWNAEGIDKSGKRIPMADSSRYKQLGNAVTVNVAEWLAKRINAAT